MDASGDAPPNLRAVVPLVLIFAAVYSPGAGVSEGFLSWEAELALTIKYRSFHSCMRLKFFPRISVRSACLGPAR
jgi:hypothetical protein